MIGEHDPRPLGGQPPGRPYREEPRDPGRPGSALRRFLGGSPVTVLVKLLFLSVLVGATMAMLGLTPGLLFWRLYDAIRQLIELGLETFHDFGRWILAGAVIVVPLWLVSRILAMGR